MLFQPLLKQRRRHGAAARIATADEDHTERQAHHASSPRASAFRPAPTPTIVDTSTVFPASLHPTKSSTREEASEGFERHQDDQPTGQALSDPAGLLARLRPRLKTQTAKAAPHQAHHRHRSG